MRALPLVALAAITTLLSCDKTGPQGDPGAEGPAGPTGATGPQGAPADATLAWLEPSSLFADRTATVRIAGTGTHFDATTKVDFGDAEIAVTAVNVASAGFLEVNVRGSARARLGAHDVTVTTTPAGGKAEKAVLHAGLLVAAALSADPQGNSRMAPQGGVVELSARNLDHDNPLGGLGRLRGGARELRLSLFGNHLFGTALVDALVAPGPLALALTATTDGTAIGYAFDAADANLPQVVARAATPLTLGQDRMGEQIAAAEATALYRFTSMADAQVVVLTATTSGPLASAVLCGALADQTGRFSEGRFLYASINGATQTLVGLLPKAGDYYVSLVPANLAGGQGYAYNLAPRAAAATRFSTKEAMPDAADRPLADIPLDGPAWSDDGAFDAPFDVDYVRIKTAKTGRLYVSAAVDALDLSNPATSVALFQADCRTLVAPAWPVQQEAAAVAGGTLCARISSPAGAVAPYVLVVTQGL